MSLPWVKLHISLLDNEAYKRFSNDAQFTFLICLMLAGKQDNGTYSGRLEVARVGPIAVADIANRMRFTPRRQQCAIDELLKAGWLSKDLTGVLTVERFEEKAAPKSYLSTDRVKSSRERFGNENETKKTRSRNGPEEEVDTDSLRSSAGAHKRETKKNRSKEPVDASWQKPMREAGKAVLPVRLNDMTPEQVMALSRLGLYEFANCRSSERTNRRKAVGFAKGLAGIARRREYGDMTGTEYMTALKRVWQLGGEAPIFDAWAAISGVDWSGGEAAS